MTLNKETIIEKYKKIPSWVKYGTILLTTAAICLGSTLPFIIGRKSFYDSDGGGLAFNNNGYDEEYVSYLVNDFERSKIEESTDLFIMHDAAAYNILQQIIMVVGSLLQGQEVYVYVGNDAKSRIPNIDESLSIFPNYHNISNDIGSGLSQFDKILENSFNYVDSKTTEKINLYLNPYHYTLYGGITNWMKNIDFTQIESFNLVSDGYSDVNLTNSAIDYLYYQRGIDAYFPHEEIDTWSLWDEAMANKLSTSEAIDVASFIPFAYDIDGDTTQDVFNSVFTGQPFYDNLEKPNPYNMIGVGLEQAIDYLKNIDDSIGKTGYDYLIEVFGINYNGDDTYDEEFFEGKTNLVYAGELHPSTLLYSDEAKLIVDSYEKVSSEYVGESVSVVYKGHPRLSDSEIANLEAKVEEEWVSRGNLSSDFDWFVSVQQTIPFEIMLIIDEFQNDPTTNTYFLWSLTLSSTTSGAYWEMNREIPYQHTLSSSKNIEDYVNWFGRSSKVVDWDNVLIVE